MKVLSVGGGPAGLYTSILLKQRNPAYDITVLEKNPANQTWGWGVVFSDETLGNLLEADKPTHQAITSAFSHWNDIDIHLGDQMIRSSGHGFSGVARMQLLRILQERATSLGVKLVFEKELQSPDDLKGYDLVLAADGVRSKVRGFFADVFQPSIDPRQAKYIWLGTPQKFETFRFIFENTPHGVMQVHAYGFDRETSTFIVELHEDTWKRAGFDSMPVEQSIRELERIFAKHLNGKPLLSNNSAWISFGTLRNGSWRHLASNGGGKGPWVVLLGDAAHTAHFSIGSGTKLALEDAIALDKALAQNNDDLPTALAAYESERRPAVERIQRAAQESLLWFENTHRYVGLEPLQFAFALLTRSLRITYENLRLRDPKLVEDLSRWFQKQCEALPADERKAEPPRPPMFTPFQLRGVKLENRVVVSPMCMYSAKDGQIDEFHLVHLGARALGGAGLLMTEMTDVSPEGRITPGCAGLYTDAHQAAWKRVVDFVHTRTASKIGVQLGHAGRKASTRLPWESGGEDFPLPASEAWETLAPSAIPYHPRLPAPREMTRADMDRVREQYVASTKRAAAAGFDWLEVHMAHGYLLATYLSPLTNRRADAYGGSIEDRLRFPIEVLESVRAAWPSDRPISVRISATDWAPGGNDGPDAVVIARALAAHGADIIHVSTGSTVPDQKPVFGRMWQTRFADQIRHEAKVPTIAVGNISTADHVNSVLVAGRADLVALARPHLLDPHWTLRAAAEQGFYGVAWPKPYLSGRPLRRP
ncbi:MAG: bifunctional salicylyl-CoA 5-hydroxylase/oxidoreductase [Deltaproteobacteria bacterium]|nr:bifunctional salicylyl-CoA 5-hydroxylase/oxidoreductase [Deltaproteobacteria bacterium]